MTQVTMLDVAKRAGVSKTTVSHVINETRFVEAKTKERVLQAIAELGYLPNVAARSLTTKRTGTIGIVVSDIANLFFGEVLLGIESVLQPENYSTIVCNTNEVLEREAYYLDMLLSRQVDGIIAAATSQRWAALAEAEVQHTPLVSVDRTFSGSEVPYVGVNNEEGAYLGTKHLIECGHRQIGIIAGFQRLSTMRERLAGFQQALQACDIPLPEEWIVTSHLKAGREATHQIFSLPKSPTALFINNNQLAVGVLLALNELGLHCPEDVSLVLFDDHPWAAISEPPLTVVRQPTFELGRTAARMLLKMIDGEQPGVDCITLECELIVRESCCSPQRDR